MAIRSPKIRVQESDRRVTVPLERREWASWIRQAEVYSKKGLINPRMYDRLLMETDWIEEHKRKPVYAFFKRAFDVIFCSVVLVTLSPILLLCATAVKFTSPGPIFFKHLRCGLRGKPFFCYKFRTYIEMEEPIRTSAPLLKSGQFLRTPAGGELRNWRLDELPQLWNVIKGDMSLVGPRPLSIEDCATIPNRYIARFAAMPGITGEWQANRPNTISPEAKLRLDCLYIRRRGFRHDLYLLWRTIWMLVQGERGSDKSYRLKHHLDE